MSDGRTPRLLLAVFLAIFLAAALAALAGCKQEGEGKRLALGGADAVEEALDDTSGAEQQAAAQTDEGAGAAAPAGPAARGGQRGPGGAGGAQVAQARGGRAGGGAGGGQRGGRGRGGGGRGRAAGAAPVATAGAAEQAPAGAEVAGTAEPGAGEEASPEGVTTGIPEVDKMAKVREFAALYGTTTLIKSKDWDDTEFEWVSLTAEEGKAKGRQIVMPVNMVTNAKYLESLEGYFPIYVRAARPLGKIVSRETISEPRKPKRTTKEIRELETAAFRAAEARRAAEEAAAQEAGVGAGPGMGGPGGRGRGGMRGGRGGRGRRGW